MVLSSLTAISPVDGRYRNKAENLAAYFSEFALIRYRVRVEIEYFIALSEYLPQLAELNTPAMKETLRSVYRDFTEADALRIKEIVADETDSMSGHLRLGVLPTIAPYIVPGFILHFSRSYPDVTLSIDEKESKTLLQDLRYGNLDMALTTTPDDMSRLLEIPVYVENFVAYFSDACSRARDLIAGGNLPADHIWILKEGHCVPDGLQDLCTNMAKGNHIYEAGSIDTLIRIVDSNGGYTIIPELHLDFLSERQKENVVRLNVDPPAQRRVSLVIKEDFVRERILNAVISTLKSVLPPHMLEEGIRKKSVRLR